MAYQRGEEFQSQSPITGGVLPERVLPSTSCQTTGTDSQLLYLFSDDSPARGNQRTPQFCPTPYFDKTENITTLHTDQKTFRKPPLLFPIRTRVSVTHNRHLRPCYRFQLKTSKCDVHFKMAYERVGWWRIFQSQSPIPGWFSPKRERWIFNCVIRRKGQGAAGVEGIGRVFHSTPCQTTGTDFQLLYLFSDDSQARGYSKGLKNLSPLPSSKSHLDRPLIEALVFQLWGGGWGVLKRCKEKRDDTKWKIKALLDLVHHPLTSFDKTENITAPHTDQKTFRKPPLLFPIPTRVSVTHNRNLRPLYRLPT
ncbi:hypothetical protein CDAR_48831 [Caerostris darwini]|uniref:Uncharacterized protein n=1 Tax=Caerostris darwini TaxID=1538125 RepID=A0AAV4NIG6_9ARAC|nr:hypothetical protein CDAR_48831 [Caerostris darwini]